MTTARMRYSDSVAGACAVLLLLALSTSCHAQDGDTPFPDSVFASPGRIGLGFRAGAVHFSGDVRDALDFAGASAPTLNPEAPFLRDATLDATRPDLSLIHI